MIRAPRPRKEGEERLTDRCGIPCSIIPSRTPISNLRNLRNLRNLLSLSTMGEKNGGNVKITASDNIERPNTWGNKPWGGGRLGKAKIQTQQVVGLKRTRGILRCSPSAQYRCNSLVVSWKRISPSKRLKTVTVVLPDSPPPDSRHLSGKRGGGGGLFSPAPPSLLDVSPWRVDTRDKK